MGPPRYTVGIDLGTTNSALAYVDTAAGGGQASRIQILGVPQLIAPSDVQPRPILPSFLYLPGEHDLPQAALGLPWDTRRDFVVGELARRQGALVPGRLVASAKSWLCNPAIDRNAAVLPWASPEGVLRLSPIDASARYLGHLRQAWNHLLARGHAELALERQEVVLTVPASFDEVARELTVEAAARAGLPDVTLLEEPQAALYSFIATNEQIYQAALGGGQLILVCDIGGGTTDFSLIHAASQGGRIELVRTAVGDHLLLGGDNMDLALARKVEARLGGRGVRLDAAQWHALWHACRVAKESLFEAEGRESWPIAVAGRGSRVVGGALREEVSRGELLEVIVDGFFPQVGADAAPARSLRTGLRELGLPYAADAAVTRHLAVFLRRHGAARPTAVLFNGGVLKLAAIRERILDVLAGWSGGARPRVLANDAPELAVARGAAYYGLVRRGQGVRIRGGAGRAYYVSVEDSTAAALPAAAAEGATSPQAEHRAVVEASAAVAAEPVAEVGTEPPVTTVCLTPRGLEEGEEVEIAGHELLLRTNRPVSFSLYGSSTRSADRPGDLVSGAADSFTRLPPVHTVLRLRGSRDQDIPVRLRARLTEVGTLELWCVAEQRDERWRLQFGVRPRGPAEAEPAEDDDQLRSGPGAAATAAASRGRDAATISERAVAEASQLLRHLFLGDRPALPAPPRVATAASVLRDLEEILEARRDEWPTPAIRGLWEALRDAEPGRGRTREHEARWLHLAGFCLRPGFGYTLDDWRLRDLWKVFQAGLQSERDEACRVQFWILWRRVAGGLRRTQQEEIHKRLAPLFFPGASQKTKWYKIRPGKQELREMWRLLASLERLPAASKATLGDVLLRRIEEGKAEDYGFWALGRLGARIPFYGPLDCVVGRAAAAAWLERLLRLAWPAGEQVALPVALIGRRTGDGVRDIDDHLRGRLVERLRQGGSPPRLVELLTEVVPLEEREQRAVFGESLPAGLRLVATGERTSSDPRPTA